MSATICQAVCYMVWFDAEPTFVKKNDEIDKNIVAGYGTNIQKLKMLLKQKINIEIANEKNGRMREHVQEIPLIKENSDKIYLGLIPYGKDDSYLAISASDDESMVKKICNDPIIITFDFDRDYTYIVNEDKHIFEKYYYYELEECDCPSKNK